jgi:hypothetical protein
MVKLAGAELNCCYGRFYGAFFFSPDLNFKKIIYEKMLFGENI